MKGKYITTEEVLTYLGNQPGEIGDNTLTRLITRAENDIDALTYYRITAKGGLDNFSAFVAGQVKQACLEQVSFLNDYGDMVNLPFKSYGINGVSITRQDGGIITQNGRSVSRQVYNLLLPTGLLYRGLV